MARNELAPPSINSLWNAAEQYIADALPGGSLNREWTPERVDAAKLGLGFTPVVGDVLSGYDALQAARQGKYGEAALNAVGLLPFVPGATTFKIGDRILTKSGARGTIVDVRTTPKRDLSAWQAKQDELHNQAFQGYVAGQHTFDEAKAIFNSLVEKNKDLLQRLYGKTTNELEYHPTVLLEGQTRPKSLFENEIQAHFGGPQSTLK